MPRKTRRRLILQKGVTPRSERQAVDGNGECIKLNDRVSNIEWIRRLSLRFPKGDIPPNCQWVIREIWDPQAHVIGTGASGPIRQEIQSITVQLVSYPEQPTGKATHADWLDLWKQPCRRHGFEIKQPAIAFRRLDVSEYIDFNQQGGRA